MMVIIKVILVVCVVGMFLRRLGAMNEKQRRVYREHGCEDDEW